MHQNMLNCSRPSRPSAANRPLWDPVGNPRLRRALFPHRAVLCCRGCDEFGFIDSFVARQYRRSFDASIHTHFNCHLALTDRKSFSSGKGILATAGIHHAAEGRLFSENYLDEPVEALSARMFGRDISRNKIIEIGNLSSINIRNMKMHLYLLFNYINENKYEYVVVTATKSLMIYLRYFGIGYKYLSAAEPDRLGPDAEKWGNYYRKQPSVLIGSVQEAAVNLKCSEMN